VKLGYFRYTYTSFDTPLYQIIFKKLSTEKVTECLIEAILT